MEDLVAKFTEASSLQYLAALVSLVWLLGATGVTRSDRSRGTPSGSTKQMFLWFSVALVTVCVLYLAFQAEADEPSFTVPATAELKVIAKVIDGDTIKLSDGTRVRLHGIDAPERNQPYGKKATRELTRLLGSSVYVETTDTDRYGRTIAVLWTSDGVNVNVEMVCKGAAWWYERYARGDAGLRGCQESARENNQGLWDGDPVAPWQWRRK
jgi:endonuclease YncB( thermonuclease family)